MQGLNTVIRRSGHRAWATIVPSLHALCENPGSNGKPQGSNPGPSYRDQLFQFQRLLTATAASVLDPVVYKLDIVTGDVRGAGTTAPASVQLIGEDGESTTFIVGNEEEEIGFRRAARKAYEFDVGRSLGNLRAVHVQQMEAGITEVGAGWFLEHIRVTGPDGRSWHFPCRSWLGKSDAGDDSGQVERTLLPREVEEAGGHMAPEVPLTVFTAVGVLPHWEKVALGKKAVNKKGHGWGGEDSYFVAYGRDGIVGLGVADGVHSWNEVGIDSGLFSRGLMEAASAAVEAGTSDPLEVLRQCQSSVEKRGLQGSSTCSIVLLDTVKGQLMSANLGDSGFALLGRRAYEGGISVKWQTPQQEHRFGCPYQLGHQATADKADDAQCFNIPVEAGDVVVMGSDGLWDNLAQDRMVAEVREALAAKEKAPELMRRLSHTAFNKSIDREADTPYSLGATEAFQMVFRGGKPDDITVLVALIT